jgi:predicted outer membrane repeat protein
MGSVAGRFLAVGAAVALAGAAALVATASPVASATSCAPGPLTVTNSADTGAGSLRAAFGNLTAAGGTICIDTTAGNVTAPITLTSASLNFGGAGAVTIDGNGATVQGNNTFSLINDASSATFTVNDLTLTTGNDTGGPGGAIHESGGAGAVVIHSSTFSNNTAASGGGAVAAEGDVTISNSTFTGNTAPGGGGAFISLGTTDSVVNSTFTNNSSPVINTQGGASALTLEFVDMVGNTGGPQPNVSLTNPASTASMYGSVLIAPAGGSQSCASASAGQFASQGYNFSNDANTTTPCNFNQPTDHVGAANDPGLGPLASNGGPTQTLLPHAGSPVLDAITLNAGQCAGEPSPPVSTDQRLLTRPSGSGCDIGAVEVQVVITPVVVTPRFTG